MKELKDELDIEQFRMLVNTPTERYHDGSEGLVAAWATVAAWVSSIKQRRLRKKVLARSHAEIEAWRQQVGIRTRW